MKTGTSGTSREKYQELEEEYAKYVGTDDAVACSTGTAALHLAVSGLGIGKGDEVIVPDFTMAASAWAVTYTGAKPVFVDCADDLLIDVSKIERSITQRTKAIMPVHVYGRVCDMDAIMAIAGKYGLRVIEDCCEAQGAMWNGKPVGSFDVGCFSFYRNKIIPAEEGGIVTTDDRELSARMRDLRSMCFGDTHDYSHLSVGFNYRMTNSQANYALTSLSNVNGIQLARYRVQSWYDEMVPEEFRMPRRDVVWVYDIRHPRKDEVVRALNEAGYAARHGFKPMTSQPMYGFKRYRSRNAYRMSKEVCYLPVSPRMTREDVAEICRIIDTVK